MEDYLVKKVENKRWLWFKNTNNYLQLEEDVFSVFEELQKGKPIEDVVKWCKNQYRLSDKDAKNTVYEIHRLTSEQMLEKENLETEIFNASEKEIPKTFYSAKNYLFNNIVFSFFYGDAKIETLLHPLFAHLETTNNSPSQKINLFFIDDAYFLNINNKNIGSWSKKDEHLFKGQIFMALLNGAYSKTEKDWTGVLHASAVGNEQNSILFLGDSGNGKSTASAIALASGLSLVADDFVPIDTGGRVLAFPAAISVKKQALEFLGKRFPELLKAKEYELKAMNKTVRYLAPKSITNKPSRAVKALIFIHYTTKVDFDIKALDKHKAFQYLVVDSWLSPEEENARFFMDWIADLPAYSLRYSNNEKMLEAVNKILEND